jgi:hypothetical protein
MREEITSLTGDGFNVAIDAPDGVRTTTRTA